MQKLLRTALFASAIVAATAASAAAGDLKLTIANGRVTLIAQDVPARQILAEWARVGQTRIVNAEKLAGPPLTLQLVDVPEQQALDIVLHAASGYVAAPRPAGVVGASQFDRIMILASSRPPAQSASTVPAAFTRPTPNVMPQPMPPDDDDGDPGDQGPVPPPGVMPPGMIMPQGAGAVSPGIQPPQQFPAGMPQPGQQQQVPMTAPRPGMLPAPQPGTPGNPYQPFPQQQPQVKKPGGEGSDR